MKLGNREFSVSDLRRRVTLQENGAAGWQTVAEVYAAVEPLSVQATIAARQASQPYTHKITIRYRAGVTGTMRVLYNGKVYEIVGPPIDKEERHRFLQLLCVELQITAPQMSQTAQVTPVVGYGRHTPEYGTPFSAQCRIEQRVSERTVQVTGYFPPETVINIDYLVECEGKTYTVWQVTPDRGVAEVAHVEVSLREHRS